MKIIMMQLLLKVNKIPQTSYFSILLGVSSWFWIHNFSQLIVELHGRMQTAHLSHEMNLHYVTVKFFQKTVLPVRYK